LTIPGAGAVSVRPGRLILFFLSLFVTISSLASHFRQKSQAEEAGGRGRPKTVARTHSKGSGEGDNVFLLGFCGLLLTRAKGMPFLNIFDKWSENEKATFQNGIKYAALSLHAFSCCV
jgi:hypothetical protein